MVKSPASFGDVAGASYKQGRGSNSRDNLYNPSRYRLSALFRLSLNLLEPGVIDNPSPGFWLRVYLPFRCHQQTTLLSPLFPACLILSQYEGFCASTSRIPKVMGSLPRGLPSLSVPILLSFISLILTKFITATSLQLCLSRPFLGSHQPSCSVPLLPLFPPLFISSSVITFSSSGSWSLLPSFHPLHILSLLLSPG